MRLPKVLTTLIVITIVFSGIFVWLADIPEPTPEDIVYGATFSKFRADELRIDWKKTYSALLEDLGIKKLRLVAHWQMIEPVENQFNFEELDYQIQRAEENNVKVTLAVGRRLPSWPECHEPDWIQHYGLEDQKGHIRNYITEVVERYKDSPAIERWQVENEPFIIGFAIGQCGELDIGFLEEEVELVHELDPAHPVLLTASGELGFWDNTWRRADVFGTTLYRTVWNRDLNSFITYPTTPGFFRAKRKLTQLTTGQDKPAVLAELAAEPWVIQAVVDTPLEEQLKRMNIDILKETIQFASRTGFEEQYLWGAEWWYYLKEVHGQDDVWQYMKQLFEE